MKTSVNNRSHTTEPLELVREDIAALKRDIVGLLGGQIEAAGDRTRRTLGAAVAGARVLADRTREQAGELHERLGKATSRRPLTTIAIALAAGIVGAKVIGWRSRR